MNESKNARLVYGPPSFEALYYSQQNSFLDALYTRFTTIALPPDHSDIINKELQELKETTLALRSDDVLQKRYRTYDHSLQNYILQFSFDNDAVVTNQFRETVKNIFADIRPLIYKLKMHYNRPRPFMYCQLHSDREFNPFSSLSANCPAFPSMHSTVGYVLLGVVGTKMPDTYKYFKDMADDIFHSRLYMGVCMRSDVDFGKSIAEHILNEKEFVVKYGL